jgi:hypothetical protein
MVSFGNWRERHNLRNPSGAGADVLLHPPEVLKGVMNTLVKCQAPMTGLQGKHVLHGAEDVARAWKCKGHLTEFPKDLVPFLDADPMLRGRNLVNDLLKALITMRGQANGEAFRIQDPA